MRSGNRTEIGAARGDDGVDVIAFENIPDGNRGNPDFISNAVGETAPGTCVRTLAFRLC